MKHIKTKMHGLMVVVLLVAVGGCYKTIECWDVAKCYLVYKGSDSLLYCGNYIDIVQQYEPVRKRVQEDGYQIILLSDTAIKSNVKLRLIEVNSFKRKYNAYCED